MPNDDRDDVADSLIRKMHADRVWEEGPSAEDVVKGKVTTRSGSARHVVKSKLTAKSGASTAVASATPQSFRLPSPTSRMGVWTTATWSRMLKS
jgi:hypothetical protein